jgi:hypothetical protein
MSDAEGQSFLESSFEVLRGAFRFTSSFFGNATAGHRVNVKIGAITAGVRGTDIWGRSNLQTDLICLIEGAISVDAEGESTTELEQSLSFYVKPKGETALPVDQIEAQQLQRWANETELDKSRGIASQEGKWQLVLSSLSDVNNVDKTLKNYQAKGFAVQQKTLQLNGKTLHRLVLQGFVSREDARNARTLVADILAIDDAWVLRKSEF